MPELKSLDYYADLAADLVDNDDNQKKRDLWKAIDTMDECTGTIPQNIQNLDWVGAQAKFFDTLPHDSIQAVTRFLSTRDPFIHVKPMLPEPGEHERMEFTEVVLDWHWKLMNRRGPEPVRTKIVRSAAKYAAVAFQTMYMPYEVKRPNLYSPREKKLMRRYGDYDWPVHNPQNVYPTYNNGFLRSALAVKVKTVYELIAEYGMENDSIKEVLKKISKNKKDNMVDARSNYVSVFDHTDNYCRAIWFTLNGEKSELVSDDDERYELLREEHKLPFIPWVIQDYGEPLLAGVYKAGIYDHKAVLNTIFYAKMLQQVADKDTVVNAANPNNPTIIDDDNNPAGERIVDLQTKVSRLPPHQIDPQLMTAMNMLDKQMAATASVSALVAIEQYIGGNTPFSSINAAQSTASAHLGPVQHLVERSIEEGLYQELQWIAYSEEPSVGYRQRGKGDTDTKRIGAQFMLKKFEGQNVESSPMNVVYINPDELVVEVELNPMTIQDKQAEANLAIIMQQAGFSRKTSLEKAGAENAESEIGTAIEEALLMKQVEIDGLKMQLAAQLEAQNAQMQLQQKQQQPPQQPGLPPSQQTQTNQMNAGAQFQATQGMDSRFGGPAPTDIVPGETRETVTGQDRAGRPLA